MKWGNMTNIFWQSILRCRWNYWNIIGTAWRNPFVSNYNTLSQNLDQQVVVLFKMVSLLFLLIVFINFQSVMPVFSMNDMQHGYLCLAINLYPGVE